MPAKKEELFSKLENVTPVGPGRYKADCPAHESKSKQALSISEVDEESIVTYCFGGCSFEDVLSAVDISPNGTGNTKVIKTEDLPPGEYYAFVSAAGEHLYMQRHKGSYYRKIGEDLWVPNLQDTAPVLYNLPGLMKAVIEGETVIHVEGCKDVETLNEYGITGATTSGGVTSWRAGFRHLYAGADVAILRDNDAKGFQYSTEVADDLYGVANTVKVVDLPGLPNKRDVTDWLEAGHTIEELFEVIEATPHYSPENELSWSTPEDLPDNLPPVEEVDESLLAKPFSGWVFDIARRMDNAAPDFAAAACVVIAGSLIGRKLGIRPKRFDDWTVVPNLWGGLIGLPATMKTPALEQTIKPMKRLSAESREAHEKALQAHTLDQMVHEAQKAALQAKLKDQAREVAKGSAERDTLTSIRKEIEALQALEEPVEKRYSTNDATIEVLGEILRANPTGILNYRDELMGWLRSLEKVGRETDRSFFLEAWNGTGSFDSDRIGRGRIFVENHCISVLGGIQPGPLTTYVRGASEESERADGLLQRFQVTVWPDTPTWQQVD